MSLTTTLAPCAASASASPRPTPRPAPVTMATLPSSMPICVLSSASWKLTCSSTYFGVSRGRQSCVAGACADGRRRERTNKGAVRTMPVDTSQIGKPTSAVRSRVELGPVDFFARAVCDENPVYHDPEAAKAAGFNNVVAPPTFTFALNHMGRAGETQPPDPTGGQSPFGALVGGLMQGGGLILHGEQEFEYRRPIQVGDVLVGEGKILDIYEKESKGAVMTFIVVETAWRDEASGEAVVTERFNLIHRR
ncbi:MAG: MaoC family dehydratase [Actinobacteria bacterium]|nr:MAG: MaoC family dehydratase [Actinomycetota bacterium]